MKNLIISFASRTGRENYIELQKGLINTLPIAGDCDNWILNDLPPEITPHSQVPYLFKFDLIKKAVGEGYRKIWHLDSTMRLLKNPFELIEQSECGVVAFHNLGHKLYPKYISNMAALNLANYYTDITKIESTWGGALGWDFDKELPWIIFDILFEQAAKGSFNEASSDREGFVAHRHDQSNLSVLFDYFKVPLLDYGVIAALPHVDKNKTYIQYGD